MAGNTVYVQGNYVDVHDNEVVNLNIDKATVSVEGEEARGQREDVRGQREEAGEQREEVNYYAPTFHLQQLLKQAWWAEVRAAERYDAAWTDAFVEALMASEYGEGIAREWAATRSCRDRIKGQVLGTLKDAGVLQGSYRQIARQVGIVVNEDGKDKKDPYKSFSDYMVRGKRQPYADWVREYAKGETRKTE